MSLDECRGAMYHGRFLINGVFRAVQKGVNHLKVISRGSLNYDPTSQSVSCTDEAGREGENGEVHLKSELKMEIYDLTLGEASAKLRIDTEKLVVSSGSHEGVELSPMQVRAGGKVFDNVVILVDESMDIDKCPYAIVREKVALHQFNLLRNSLGKTRSGSEFGEPVVSRMGAQDKDDLLGVALVGENIAVRLESKADLPKRCQSLNKEGRTYLTNHQDVLAVELGKGANLDVVRGNAIHLEELTEDLVTGSRLDLLAFHMEEVYKNLSQEVGRRGCLQDLNDVGEFMDQDPGYKNRVLPAGEAILISKCRRVEVVAGWAGNTTVGSSCPKYLPVKFPGRKEQLYLEPNTRFLYQSAPMQPCGLSHLVPIYLEDQAGNYVSFNGSSFVKQEIEVMEWEAKRAYYSEAGLSFWKDITTLGMLTEEEVNDLEIYQQYNVYLTRRSEQDQEPDLEQGPLSKATGSRIQSWVSQLRERTRKGVEGYIEEGLDLTEEGRMVKALWSAWERMSYTMSTLGMIGGVTYLTKAICGGAFRCLKAVYRTRSASEMEELYKGAQRAGCESDPVCATFCIICKETLQGPERRKRLELKRMVKEMIDEEILATKGHLRALIFNEEAQARRSSREGSGVGDLELVRLRQH